MKRPVQGALVERLTAAVVASTILWSALPVVALAQTENLAGDTNIKTLPPLNDGALAGTLPIAPQASELKPALKFTKSADDESPSAPYISPPIADVGVQPTDAASTPVAASPEKVAPPALPTAADNQAPSLAPELPLGTTQPLSAAEPQSQPAAQTPAPPEVTAPQPVAASSEADKAAIAQGAGAARTVLDPAMQKMPVTLGSFNLKTPFNRFPTNQLIHNVSFRDTPVKEVIAELCRQGNLNVIIDKSCMGKITGDLRDVTLNEAMDTVLSSSALTWRQLDNTTTIIGSPGAMYNLGLNRSQFRAFKCNYADPFMVANLLWTTIFNRGWLPDFTMAQRNREVYTSVDTPSTKTAENINRQSAAPGAGGGTQTSQSSTVSTDQQNSTQDEEAGLESNNAVRPDQARNLRSTSREQTNEGNGYNSAATDPGSETVRTTVKVISDFTVDQNGGGAIAVPDAKNRQVIVVGTADDIALAEQAIRIFDRRPRQVHIQTSLIELTNEGIRQIGAALNLQGFGSSGTVLGGSGAPLLSFLPGLGSNSIAGIPPVPLSYATPAATPTSQALLPVIGVPSNGFLGFLGNALPAQPPAIAGVQAVNQAQTGFNFLTLSKGAGGRFNIATLPQALNVSLNLVLQTNKAKVLANPSVTVNDDTEALVVLANEVVHKVTTTVSLGVVSTNVELVKAGIFLDVLPRIGEDGFVTLRLRPQVSQPLGAPQTFANGSVVVTLLNVREVIAQEVRVKDGQTLVLGGLFTEQEASTLAKVPYLAEAPILGALFRNTIKGRNRTELMLLVTPKVVEDPPPNPIAGGASPTL